MSEKPVVVSSADVDKFANKLGGAKSEVSSAPTTAELKKKAQKVVNQAKINALKKSQGNGN